MSQPADLVPAVEAELLPEYPSRLGQRVRRLLPALVLFVLALVVWEAVVAIFHIEGFLLPRPSAIATKFVQELRPTDIRACLESGPEAVGLVARPDHKQAYTRWDCFRLGLVGNGLFTLREAAGGFIMGCTLGVLVAMATSRWSVVKEGALPFAIAINSTPIVALAPIMNQWFGITNPLSKMSIVAVIVFFPVMINAVRGLTQVEAGALELMRSYAASDFRVLFDVRIPNAFPYVFSAFKVASTLSVIGAVVSEYFGGSRDALGVYISQQAALFHFAEAWAAIIVACVMGIAFYLLLLLVERLVMPWHVSLRAAD